jgi:catechol 2,3-dioxygenase-like lactoylglutathione lyase family enzyme
MSFKSTRENIAMSTAPVYTYTYDHIHVRTKDPEGVAGFFETMFGATVLRLVQSDGAPRVDVDVNGLAIFIATVAPEEHIEASPSDPHLGLDHFGLRVDDIDGAVEDLRSKGAEIYVEPRTIRPGVRIAFVRGPDDVRIELLQRDGSGLQAPQP